MSRVAVVTDSTADLAADMAAAAGIRVVPLYVQFGSEEFQAGVNLSTEQFWTRLLAPGAPFPKTAAPSPGTFRETFEACFADGADAVVCPVIGSKLSGTFGSATLAAQALPDREIHVIDTCSTSMSTGIPALIAAEMAAAGASGGEISAHVRSRLPDVDLWVAVDTLDYLVTMSDRQRTRARARALVVERIAAKPVERLSILHAPTSAPEEVTAFRDQLLAAIPGGLDPERITIGLIGASTGPHLGPDLMGAAFLRRPA